MLRFLKKQKVKIRTNILFETIATLVLTVIIIISYTYYSNTKAIIEQCEITMQKGVEFLQTQISEMLRGSESFVCSFAPVLETLPLDDSVMKKKGILNSLSHHLKAHSYVTTLYFGTEDGYFFEISMPNRVEKYLSSSGVKQPGTNIVSIAKIISHLENQSERNLNFQARQNQEFSQLTDQGQDLINHRDGASGAFSESPKEIYERWIFIDETFNHIEHMGQKTPYDHRKRGWYKSSLLSKGAVWSDIYIFASTLKNEAGITVSKTVYKNNAPVGVFALDLTVTTFSEFLQKNPVSRNSVSYVINDKKEVIASSVEKKDPKETSNNANPLPKVDTMDDVKIKIAYEKYIKNKEKDNIIFFSVGGKEYIASFQDFPKIFSSNWKGVVIAPMEDFIGKVSESTNNVLLFSAFVVLCAMLLSFKLAQRISKPVVSLAQEAKNIKDLTLIETPIIESNIDEISDLAESIAALKSSMKAFSNYIPRTLVQKLLQKKGAIHIGGRSKEITLLFTDIEGFTSISEKISPENLVVYLSDYFQELTKILIEHDATVDKFIGDAIMAFWGAPLPDKNQTFNACRAVLLCIQKLNQKNLIWKKQNRPVFYTRFGIHTGHAIVGNIGSSERMNFTAIGDNINFASRLEGLNKFYGTSVLVSEAVYDKVKDKFLFRSIDKVSVKGSEHAIKIFELVAQTSDDGGLLPSENEEIFVQEFEKAYKLYLAGQFDLAYNIFSDIDHSIRTGDKSVHIYLQRCQDFIQQPPPENWDGTHVYHEK